MLLKIGSKDSPTQFNKLARALRKKSPTREGVHSDGAYGFPTLSFEYVSRIRKNLLLWTDDDLKSMKILPARITDGNVPFIQVELDTQIIKGSKKVIHTGSACMKVLPNAQTYTRKGRPLQIAEGSQIRSNQEFLRPTSPEMVKVRSIHSPGRDKVSVTSSLNLLNRLGEDIRSDMSEDGENSVRQIIEDSALPEECKAEIEEQEILNTVLQECVELNPQKKLGIAQRKISVHQPVLAKRGHDPLAVRLSALELKQDLLPPLVSQKSMESYRARGKKVASKFRHLGSPKEHSGSEPDQDQIYRTSTVSLPNSNERSRKGSMHYEPFVTEHPETIKEPKATQNQQKQRSRKAFRFLNNYVTRLKKVPREQKLETLHKSLQSVMKAGSTPGDAQLQQVTEFSEVSENEEDDEMGMRLVGEDPRSRKHSLTNVDGQFYEKMTNVLAEIMMSTSSILEPRKKQSDRLRKFSERLIDEMELQLRSPQHNEASSDDNLSYVEQKESIMEEVEGKLETGSATSLEVEQGNSPTLSEQNGASTKQLLTIKEGGSNSESASTPYSFKLHLQRIKSSQRTPSGEEAGAKSERTFGSSEKLEMDEGLFNGGSERPGGQMVGVGVGVGVGVQKRMSRPRVKTEDMDYLLEQGGRQQHRASMPKMLKAPMLQQMRGDKLLRRKHSAPKQEFRGEDKILETEKGFKINMIAVEQEEAEGGGLHEEVWRRRILEQMSPDAKRRTGNWREWYK